MKILQTMLSTALMLAVAGLARAETPSAKEVQQKHDQRHSAVQAICPMTGNKLGEHGPPVKVKIGEEEIFLCCKACLKKPVNTKYWATIHANFAKAQGICPVMKNKLPKNPKWAVVNGAIVYVCCPPCIKKLNAEPVKYLRDVDALYAASLKKKHKPETTR